MDDIRDHWPTALADHTQILDRLLEAYSGSGRGYHDLRHLTEVLDRIEEILRAGGEQVDHDAVVLGAWFHDAVYEPEGDNEEHSAVLAEGELAAVDVPPDLVDEVARLVRLTASHRPEDGDVIGQVLCDADLAVLAASPDRYRDYVAGVRTEYSHVSDENFRAGRAAVLRDLISKPTLFHTSFALQHWESAARANVARELRGLEN